jgi:hypothetical protein
MLLRSLAELAIARKRLLKRLADFEELLGVERRDAYLVWSRKTHGGCFDGRQPESLSAEEWSDIASAITDRRSV